MSKKKKVIVKEEAILINRLFSGEYLEERNNIGHEVINLFSDDEGEHYVYIVPYGSVNDKHDIQYIFFVRGISKEIFEVLSMAKIDPGKKYATKNNSKENSKNNDYAKNKQQEYSNKIKYGEKTLYDIFENNYLKGNKDETPNYITYKIEQEWTPKNRTFLIKKEPKEKLIDKKETNEETNEDKIKKYESLDGSCEIIEIDDVIVGTDARRYIVNGGSTQNVYEKLIKELIDKSTNAEKEKWKETKPPKFAEYEEQRNKEQQKYKVNFFGIIGKENDELVFSNMLSYYFTKYPDLWYKFREKVLKIEEEYENYRVVREQSTTIKKDRESDDEQLNDKVKNGRIDIFVEEDKDYIVIENKIKSGINGQERHDFNSETVTSQLNKYIKYVDKLRKKKEKKAYYFIFAPEYNYIDPTKYGTENKLNYKIIKYSQIYDFFTKYGIKDDPYYSDFLSALYIHTMSKNELNYEIMKARFYDAIREAKK